MLPNSPHVKTAVTGPDGILAGKHEGMILLEMSSIAPLATKEIGKLCEEAGVPMLEAPVSGGVGGAAEEMCIRDSVKAVYDDPVLGAAIKDAAKSTANC